MAKSKQWRWGRFHFSIGISSQVALAIYVNSLFAGIDILCFYVSVEY